MVPRILPGRWKWFVRDTDKLNFGIGASGVAGKAAPTTNTLALQDGEVSSIQGLLGYLNCEAKDTYIVHLLLGIEEDDPSRLYNIESPIPVLKKQPKKVETLVKKERKGPLSKKVKKEVETKVSLFE
jgi:hypothetical protein